VPTPSPLIEVISFPFHSHGALHITAGSVTEGTQALTSTNVVVPNSKFILRGVNLGNERSMFLGNVLRHSSKITA